MKKNKVCALALSLFVIISLLCMSGCQTQREKELEQMKEEILEQEQMVKEHFNPGYKDKSDDPEDKSETEEELDLPFTKNEDIKVVYSYTNKNDKIVIIENVSNEPILDIRLAMTEMDSNGLPLSRDDYSTGKIDAVNLMPGQKTVASFYGAEGKYLLVTVAGVEYANGKSWEATNLDSWATKVQTSFDPTVNDQILSSIAPNAKKAEQNDFLEIVSTSKKNMNRFSDKDGLTFNLKNIGSEDILEATLTVIEYDKNGYPVSVSPYDTLYQNVHNVGGNLNLASGETGSYGDELFFQPTCEKYKIVIKEITFSNDDVWENPFYYEWVIVNANNFD